MNEIDVNAIVRDPNDPRYPSCVSVFCDECGITVCADYLVHEDDDQATRFGYARAHLRTLGWVCDKTGDYCPDCVAQRQNTAGGAR